MKIKNFIAVAALLMGSTSAFATAVDFTQEYTYEGLVYTLHFNDNDTPTDLTDDVVEAKVKSVSDDATYKAKTTWEIPEKFKALAVNGADPKIADKMFTVNAIGASAFANNSNITSITFAKAENITAIDAAAFSKTSITTLDLSGTKIGTLNQLFEDTNSKVTTVSLPKSLATIEANAFNGLSALNSVTFAEKAATDPAYALTIKAYAFKNTMALTTLTLPANVQYIAANAFANTYLTTLTINGTMPDYVATSDGVEPGAFVRNGTQTLTVTYKPAKKAGAWTNPFATTTKVSSCFATAALPVWVTLSTSSDFGANLETLITTFNGVKISYAEVADGQIPVFNQGGKFSYGTWYDAANGIEIAKKQGENKDINVMVYGAYVDNAAETAILMEQLHLIEGKYYIPAGTKVIIKSSSDAKVDYNKYTGTLDSRNFKKSSTTEQNEIQRYAGPADTYAVNITPLTSGNIVIFLKPLDETAFGWAEFSDNRVVKAGQFYLEATPAAAARVIWLDGSEEDQVTAIKNVKTAAKNDGAIYNLAGQKVNAAYKGVVIKDGKKYIQK